MNLDKYKKGFIVTGKDRNNKIQFYKHNCLYEKATLIIDGKEITVEIDIKDLEEKPFPQVGDMYWVVRDGGRVLKYEWEDFIMELEWLKQGNIFKTEQQAKNLARARALIQAIKVRRKELNGDWELDFSDNSQSKHYIYYYPNAKDLEPTIVVHYVFSTSFGYYKDKISAQKIIDEFHDDLIWYFTEYIPEVN